MTLIVANVMPITGSGAKAAARLCNFETSQSFLLRDHIDFLDGPVASAIRSFQTPWVELRGYASRAGDAGYNQKLSERRIAAVRARIEQFANKVNFQVYVALGESQSGDNERDNSGYYRAVEVLVFGTKPPPPPQPKPPEEGSRSFAIKCLSSFSLAFPVIDGPQGSMMTFAIVDITARQSASYSYNALGITVPSGPSLSPISFAGAGPWKKFGTTNPVNLNDFVGRVDVGQEPGAQLGNKSAWGNLQVMFDTERLGAKLATTIPRSIIVGTGSGFAAPSLGSYGVGNFKMIGGIDAFLETVVEG
ncbi:hypothetical protein KEU06_19350 [Pseudaminobacter sp. 19-2017]|uniref:OmpA-like domain-containing protein n=1 Tax=Pseudaminobacter soli (ex Zhang et al. 2022) TaxID=2831468 RepID=A0A942E4E1_9HYPH|nr:hypothetical protein [Pseudaminobacter soli]MBS3650771.1 hypothetical protein [Pseudaminobacter soli]